MKNTNIKGNIAVFSVFFLSLFSIFLSPSKIEAASLTNASALLSNPRLSYRANSATGTTGSSTVTITNSTSYPDPNTNHLFPGDSVCFTNAGPTGCISSKSYSVATVSGAQSFSLASTLLAGVDASGFVISTQSGNITLTFTLVSAIPAGGDIFIRIPVSTEGSPNVNDGIPDPGKNNSGSITGGFDFNKLQSTSISVSTTGGTCADGWNTPVVASTSGTIQIVKATSACTGATVTVVIPSMVNPTPWLGTGSTPHVQGTADAYKISIVSRDGSTNVLDSTNVVVAPIEGVLISATVDQTLSFTVAGVASGQTACNVSTTVGTTPYSVPWGTLAIANQFSNAAQLLSVSTNASNGYLVTIEENDQMGMNGIACTGRYAGEANSCIKDTGCDSGSCDYANYGNWATPTNNGLGYSLASVSGTPASFYWGGASNWYAKALPDQEPTSPALPKQTIMSAVAPVSNNQINVCYRISISGTQPAGYYYNKVRYTATARF